MIEYIGNCSDVIDWDSIVLGILKSKPLYVGPTHDINSFNVPGAPELANQLRSAGHKLLKEGGSMGWSMYVPGEHFDSKVVNDFCNFVNLNKSYFCWISCVQPGHMAPWHWDITDEEKTNNTSELIKRYHCHITEPHDGHFFVVENTCLYKEEKGAVYKWPSRNAWHAGSNAGLESKLIFNIWGV